MSAFVWWNGTFALVQSTGRTLSDGLSSPYEILRVPRVQAALNWASRAVSMTSFSLRTPWIPLYAVMCCGCCMTPRWQRLETWDRFLENSTDMKCTQISMIQHDTTIAREGPWLAPLFFCLMVGNLIGLSSLKGEVSCGWCNYQTTLGQK